jgi:hypothetical protein
MSTGTTKGVVSGDKAVVARRLSRRESIVLGVVGEQ